MSDIFISYSSADRSRIEPLVEGLQQQGWSVWWDRSILPGKAWEDVIERALVEAKCVIVVWSRNSIHSDWVRAEADDARQRGILVPALLDDVTIPLPFRRIQAANLIDWSGALPFAGFEELSRAVAEAVSAARPDASQTAILSASTSSGAAAARQHVERGEALQEASEPQSGPEPNGSAKEELAASHVGRGERRALVRKRAVLFGIPAVSLIGIAVYINIHNGHVERPSPKLDSGPAISVPDRGKSPVEVAGRGPEEKDQRERASPPAPKPRAPTSSLTPVTPHAAGEVRENPKDGGAYVWIPPGRFIMGCSQDDDDCEENEEPSHPVRITKGFWMGQTEVTQGAYQRVMNANPSHFDGALIVILTAGLERTRAQIRTIRAQLPVELVSWNEASQYCRNAGLRLPTEAEWEYAARAGMVGARYGDLDKIAWYGQLSSGYTRPVRGKQPNSWGLSDMLGNVAEWTADWWGHIGRVRTRTLVARTAARIGLFAAATGTSLKILSGSHGVTESSF